MFELDGTVLGEQGLGLSRGDPSGNMVVPLQTYKVCVPTSLEQSASIYLYL